MVGGLNDYVIKTPELIVVSLLKLKPSSSPSIDYHAKSGTSGKSEPTP